MIKIIITMLLLSLSLSANSVDNGVLSYKKACDDGNLNSCVKLGIVYFVGDGVEQNHKKAKKLFKKACKKKYSAACYHLGTLYKRGGDGIKRNYKKSRFYYARACRMGLIKSCDQYNLIRQKREIVGSGSNDNNFSYTYTTEIYGG